jgi:hypothetical protein
MTHKRIDANQPSIVATLRAVGAEWISTTRDPGVGFDGIICFRGEVHLVELKDGSKPPSRRRLTDNETRRREQLERVGVKVHIIESADDALRVIGAL